MELLLPLSVSRSELIACTLCGRRGSNTPSFTSELNTVLCHEAFITAGECVRLRRATEYLSEQTSLARPPALAASGPLGTRRRGAWNSDTESWTPGGGKHVEGRDGQPQRPYRGTLHS